MDQGVKRIEAVLQRMFTSSSTNEDVDKVKTLTEAYHNYKREYVKHLSFTSEGENLSRFILICSDIFIIGFSHSVGACPIGGSVHLF